MRKLDLQSKEDSELIATIKSKTRGFNNGAVLTEIFISKNGTIFINAITKGEKKTSSHLFILVEGKHKELEVSSSIMDTTFVPVADSELIGLLKSSIGDSDSYRVVTDIDSKYNFGEKAKEIKGENNNCLVLPINYNLSSLDVILDLNTGNILGYIDYISNVSVMVKPEDEFSLAVYENEFIEVAKGVFTSFEEERIYERDKLLEKVSKSLPNQGIEIEGEL